MSTRPAPPRLYCIQAISAPIVLIFRRGPSKWFHVLRWNIATCTIEPGAWVNATIYPRRCDVSPDGELLLFFRSVTGRRARYPLPNLIGPQECTFNYRAYAGISRAPWLDPLVCWDEMGTYGSGWFFIDNGDAHGWNAPDFHQLGSATVHVRLNDATPFVNERRRGWVEAPDMPRVDPHDPHDPPPMYHRPITLQKASPCGRRLLRLIDKGYTHGPGATGGHAPTFELEQAGAREPIVGAVWTDWDPEGRLLIATIAGQVRIERFHGESRELMYEFDTSTLEPCPRQTPEWATLPDAPRA